MKGTWIKLLATASCFSCLLWIFGLGWVLFDYFDGSENTSIETSSSQLLGEAASNDALESEGNLETEDDLNVVALGDSLTRGVGDTTGKGYVGYFTDQLKENFQQEVVVSNLGIGGQTSSELVSLIEQKEVSRQIEAADIVLITTGGNDLFQGGQTLLDMNMDNISKLQETYLRNLDVILSGIEKSNPGVKVFLIGLYNPFLQLDPELTPKVVKEWNYKGDALVAKYPNTVFIPTYDLFQLNTEDYLYTDKFHPNTEGYKLIAERVVASFKW